MCDAVLHAHQQLIVHRDLKPGNIMVTTGGEPKLLDFGIAKLIAEGAEQGPALTAEGATLSTPEYASPEQVRGEPITVATDVYALGAVLYELLTGVKAHRFETRSPVEIGRVVCDTAVTRPSVAVLNDAAGQVKLARQLAGDLDTIVLKALHKEPARRYASVEQFSEDLRRYLDGRPVMARPDTTLYRTTKFIRRNTLLVGATTLAVASLIVGLAISIQQTQRADRRFQQVRALANRLLTDIEPQLEAVPGTAGAQRALAAIATEYLDSLRADAAADPALLLEVADGYVNVAGVESSLDRENLGQNQAALATYDKALAITDGLASTAGIEVDVAAVVALAHLGIGQVASVTRSRADAIDHYRQAVAAADRGLQVDARNERLISLAMSAENRLGDLLAEAGQLTQAVQAFERSLALTTRTEGIVTTKARLAGARRDSGDPAGALALFRECPRNIENVLRGSPNAWGARHTLALLQADIGSTLAARDGPSLWATDEGLAIFREALDTARVVAHNSNYDPLAIRLLADVSVGFGAVASEADPKVAIGPLGEILELVTKLRRTADASDLRLQDARLRSALARALSKLGRHADARREAAAATSDLQALVDADLEDVVAGDALVLAHVHLGEAHVGLGGLLVAEEQLRLGVEAAGRTAQRTPQRVKSRALQAIARRRLAAFLIAHRPASEEAKTLIEASRIEWQSWLEKGWAEPFARAELQLLANLLK